EPMGEGTEAYLRPVLRLLVTVGFGVRLLLRLAPHMLDRIEGCGYRPLVAARHLRSKKSSFLGTISVLAVLSVAFSTSALVTVLSVMGGFRNDLKQKILGNHAHIIVDHASGRLQSWRAVLRQVEAQGEVRGASPFLSGEVMLTSVSNMAGALLRGVERERASTVTDLRRNLREGKLRYLDDPEALLRDSRQNPETTGTVIEAPSVRPAPVGAPSAARKPRGEAKGADAAGRDPVAQPTLSAPQADRARPSASGALPSAAATGTTSLVETLGLEDDDDIALPAVILGQELARSLRVGVGDEVTVVSPFGDIGPGGALPKSRPFRVGGVFYSGMYEYDMKYAFIGLDEAMRFFRSEGAIGGIEVKLQDIEMAPRVAMRWRRQLRPAGLRVRDWQQTNRNLFGALALEKLAMFITLGIAILVAGFCVFGTLTLMVQEKGREVAILKTMGTTGAQVMGIFLIEGLLVGLLGAASGLALGFVVCYVAEHFGIHMNPEVYYIDRLPVHIDAVEFALVGLASAVVCLLATALPAWLGSRLRPADALRYQ
ncbi:MAG: FtsX-like permease family protein, partial [Polyangiales bacterium]